VTARLVECTFIAIGIVGMLALSSLRQDPPPGTTAAVGQGIFAVYEWTFRPGPGVFAGVGNGLILGWLMSRSGLVPPRLAVFGLVGGPLVSGVGVLVIVGVGAAEGPVQVLVAPEFIGELGIGLYLIVKGYRTSSPALAGPRRPHSSSPASPGERRRNQSPTTGPSRRDVPGCGPPGTPCWSLELGPVLAALVELAPAPGCCASPWSLTPSPTAGSAPAAWRSRRFLGCW
jgi:hypothetical protein